MVQSTPLTKYRETEGIQDAKGTSGGGSVTVSKIDATQWEDYGNSQGASEVIRRFVLPGTAVRRPANPTPINTYNLRLQFYDSVEGWTNRAFPSTWYDCTTWDSYYTYPEYDYVGVFGGGAALQTETKWVLARVDSGIDAQSLDDVDFEVGNYAWDID